MMARFRPNNNPLLKVLQIPNFRRYFVGQSVSISGTWMQRVAQGWLVYALTQSETWLGTVAFASGLAMLLMVPYSGVLADRVSRRKLLMLAQAIEMILALLLAGLTFWELVTVEQIVLLSFGLGIATALGEPARQALVNDLVGTAHVGSGIALNASLMNTAGIVGPVLAGIALVQLGAAWCFLLNGLSYLVVLYSLQRLELPLASRAPFAHRPHFLRQMQEAIHYVAHEPSLQTRLLSGLLFSICGIGLIQTLLPALASIQLDSPKTGLAATSAAIGLGSVVGGLLTIAIGQRWGQARVVGLLAMVLPFGNLWLAWQRDLWQATLLLGFLGFGYTIFYVTTNTLIQQQVNNEQRGRVMSLWSMNRFGLQPVSSLALGTLAQSLGIPSTLTLCAMVALLVSFWLFCRPLA